MGAWGNKLYENDTALDVKDQFEEQISLGKNAEDITQQLISDFDCEMDAPLSQLVFWLALADTQWNWGRLQPDVKDRALCCIKEYETENPAISAVQRNELDRLQSKLLSPQPHSKKPVKKRIYRCKWKKGDVFAYKLESNLAKEVGLWGQFFLIQKVSERSWYPGHIIPIAYVKITKEKRLPTSVEEYNSLEYVQTWFTRYEERFFPIDMTNPQEDIAKKSKIDYKVDAFGFLPQYRIALLSTSARVIPGKLIYVGNFCDAAPPAGEFIPHVKENIAVVSWGKSGENFENVLIKRYCGHNLRGFEIYANRNGETL